ncbi:MAG: hypothetical protein H7Y60_17805 [Rhodospirillaceae bacterium]|nr:hypothetical protein [Rhodospirillales bacterium]
MSDGADWTPVAGQAVGVFGQVDVMVQFAIVGAVTLVAIIAIVGIIWARTRPPDNDTATMATVIAHLAEEFSRQVGHQTTSVERLAEVVEDMRQTIVGCATCAYHPNARKDGQ